VRQQAETLVFLLVAPAPLLFAVRRLDDMAHLGWNLGAAWAGILALVGLIVLMLARWRGEGRWRAWGAGFLVLVGHGLLDPQGLPELAAAFTYLGIGIAGSLRGVLLLQLGAAAAAGALLGWLWGPGDVVVLVAAAVLGIMLVVAALRGNVE
jgi:hypothetical protein